MRLLVVALPALLSAAPLYAASLNIVKSNEVVSDGVNLLNPKGLPGAITDFSLLVTNPVANLLASVRSVTITDPVAPQFKLRVRDLGGAGSGPIEFMDGNLLNLGLLGSGLTHRFSGLASTTDGVEFSDGQSWGYSPVADADGYDSKVRAIRVTLSGNHAPNSSFRLRYRVALR